MPAKPYPPTKSYTVGKLPRQPRYRARWLTNREGVEFFMRDQLNRQVSQHATVEGYGSGRRATKSGAHHRHHAAGTKRLPKVGAGVGWLAFKLRLAKRSKKAK